MLACPLGQGREYPLCRGRARQHSEAAPILEQAVPDIAARRGPGGILDPSGPGNAGFVHSAAGKGDERNVELGQGAGVVKRGIGQVSLELETAMILHPRPGAVLVETYPGQDQDIGVAALGVGQPPC